MNRLSRFCLGSFQEYQSENVSFFKEQKYNLDPRRREPPFERQDFGAGSFSLCAMRRRNFGLLFPIRNSAGTNVSFSSFFKQEKIITLQIVKFSFT